MQIKHLGQYPDLRKPLVSALCLQSSCGGLGVVMDSLTDLEKVLLAACQMALRQLEYDGDDKTAFTGASFEVLTKAIAAAEAKQA